MGVGTATPAENLEGGWPSRNLASSLGQGHTVQHAATAEAASLDGLYAPGVELHVLWCGERMGFHNYLSIKSAIEAFRPALVHLHCGHTPGGKYDPFDWYTDIMLLFPLISTHVAGPRLCPLTAAEQFVRSLAVAGHRQVIITASTVLLPPASPSNSWDRMLVSDSAKSTVVTIGTELDGLLKQQTDNKVVSMRCATACTAANVKVNSDEAVDSCCAAADNLEPEGLLDGSGISRRRLLELFYGVHRDPFCPLHYFDDVIPRIGHYVLGSQRRSALVDYAFYLSILSVLNVVGVKCVYVHSSKQPSGHYWDQLTASHCVRWINWPLTDQVWGYDVIWPQQADDILRAEVLLRYGGLLVEPTVYFHRALPEKLWHFETVLSTVALGERNSAAAAGIMMAKPDSRFLHRFIDRQHACYEPGTGGLFAGAGGTYNSGLQLSNVYRRHPTSAYAMPDLLALCAHDDSSACLIGSREESGARFTSVTRESHCLLQQDDVYAFYFTEAALPAEFTDEALITSAPASSFVRRLSRR